MQKEMLEAIGRVKQDILDGHVVNYAIEDACIYVETAEGWCPRPYYVADPVPAEDSLSDY